MRHKKFLGSTLLNPAINYYFVERNWEYLDHRNIYSELGNIIGKIQFSSKNKISVLEPHNEELFVVQRKGKIFPTYEMRDTNGISELIFKLKKSGPLSKRGVFMKSVTTSEVLEAKITNFWTLEIKNKEGNKIASFARLSHAFLPSNLNLNLENAYGLHAIDQHYNKKYLLSFFIVILDSISRNFFIDHFLQDFVMTEMDRI